MINKIKKNDVSYIEQLVKIEQEIFKNSAYSHKTILEFLNDENYSIYIYNNSGKIYGYMIILDSVNVYEILKIATIKEERNKNIASKLLEKIKEKDIFLEVRESNKTAINFYKKNNFKQITIRKKYYSDTNENAIIMKLEVGNE